MVLPYLLHLLCSPYRASHLSSLTSYLFTSHSQCDFEYVIYTTFHLHTLLLQCDYGYVVDSGSMYNYNACIATSMYGDADADTDADTSRAPSPPPPRDCTGMEGAGYLACCEGVRLGGVVLVSWAMLVNLTHIFFLRRWTTCSVTFVTRLRLSLLGLAFFGQTITLFMILLQWDGWFLVLCIGGGLALVGLLCFAIYKVCFAPPPEHETDQVRKDRIKKAHEKMLRKGYNKKGVFSGGRGSPPVPTS